MAVDFSYVPGVFGNQQKRYLEVIKNMLQQSLSDASSYKVGELGSGLFGTQL